MACAPGPETGTPAGTALTPVAACWQESIAPLFEVRMELDEQGLVFFPSLELGMDYGFLALIEGLIDDIYNVAKFIPRLAKGRLNYKVSPGFLRPHLSVPEGDQEPRGFCCGSCPRTQLALPTPDTPPSSPEWLLPSQPGFHPLDARPPPAGPPGACAHPFLVCHCLLSLKHRDIVHAQSIRHVRLPGAPTSTHSPATGHTHATQQNTARPGAAGAEGAGGSAPLQGGQRRGVRTAVKQVLGSLHGAIWVRPGMGRCPGRGIQCWFTKLCNDAQTTVSLI